MSGEIKCSVTECAYNQNIRCGAPMIQVERNYASNAKSSNETKCETFKSKA
jgi:hypothetical protein